MAADHCPPLNRVTNVSIIFTHGGWRPYSCRVMVVGVTVLIPRFNCPHRCGRIAHDWEIRLSTTKAPPFAKLATSLAVHLPIPQSALTLWLLVVFGGIRVVRPRVNKVSGGDGTNLLIDADMRDIVWREGRVGDHFRPSRIMALICQIHSGYQLSTIGVGLTWLLR